MAVSVDVIKTVGKLIFNLERGEDTSTRTLDVAVPKTDEEDMAAVQTAVNQANSIFSGAENSMNVFIQPANWRDTNIAEEQWVTKSVHYEIVTTVTREVTADVNQSNREVAYENQEGEHHQEGEQNQEVEQNQG